MKIVFYSNSLSHHQIPFCLEMAKIFGDEFVFVATEEITEERLRLGYEDLNNRYAFVLRTYESEQNQQKALELAVESDVVIIGSAPEQYLEERMKHNKLTFRYMERPLKQGRIRLLNPRKLHTMIKMHTRYAFKKLFLLCASAYTSGDCALVGGYWNKAYKWGYFPDTSKLSYDELLTLKKDNQVPHILWAGRLIDYKNPESALILANRLKKEGYKFKLNIIGEGKLRSFLEKKILDLNLSDCVALLGPMNPKKVCEFMEKANIYLFTSNQEEGWGAVLNEAMGSACTVVANKKIGAVPFLMKHKKNGLRYKEGSDKDLYKKVLYCLQNPDKCELMGKKAYDTINEEWNASVATERFVEISKGLLKHKKKFYKGGPISRARWM